jgi:hypothetical protein
LKWRAFFVSAATVDLPTWSWSAIPQSCYD